MDNIKLMDTTPRDYSSLNMDTSMIKYTTPIEDARDKLIQNILDHKDKLIRKAIDHGFGKTDWTLEEATSRCTNEVMGNTFPKEEYFCVDGKRMILFTTPQFKMEGNKASHTINYKVLYNG